MARERRPPVDEGHEPGLALAGPDAVLAALDPDQQEVARATRGPVCVLAGAGTGKTRAVAHRIAYAVATGVVRPDRVLAVTFTTKAAGELRARLRQLGSLAVPGAGLEHVQARTFHSAALRQLTHFWPATVGGPAPAVVDSKIGLLADAARRLRQRPELAELRDAASEIEWAKVTQVRPGEYPLAAEKTGRIAPLPAEAIARLYAGYEELRRERNLVDFESVLELTAAILDAHPTAAAAVRDRYRYFVVDEYQDVNPLQKLLLDRWVGARDDVCVVGDPRQTIYSFTGATPAYLSSFPVQYQGAVVIRLLRNYRSSPQVVALANQLLATGGQQLIAQRPSGPAPEFSEYADEQDEASDVARRAAALIAAGTAPSQIAVLVRTNAMTSGYEQALASAGVPFQLRGTERFFDRTEIKQAVTLLRVAARSASPDEGPGATVRAVLTGLGLSKDPPAGRGRARERWESLETLGQLAADFFAARGPDATLADLAGELELRSSIGHVPQAGGVTLASLHAAKGLEWDVVFLPCLTDGALPIVYAQSAAAIEEERRLLYVGVTRARDQLFLSWSLARAPGGRQARTPSRFLAGLPGRPPGRSRKAVGGNLDRYPSAPASRAGRTRGRPSGTEQMSGRARRVPASSRTPIQEGRGK
jgi:DNA helicase II / ATP-dependent DNA helicase PcrA